MNEFYKILGVNNNITDDELKTVHRNLLKRYHPDTYLGDKDYASKRTIEINQAYAEIVAYRAKNNIKIEKKNPENQTSQQFSKTTVVQPEIKQKKPKEKKAKEEKPKDIKPVDYSEVAVENSAEILTKKYKKQLSLEEIRSKRIIDILIYSLSAITIGLILFMIFYK